MTVAIEPPRRAAQPVGTLPPLNQRLLAAMGAEVLVIPSIAHARDLLRGTLPTTSGTMTMRPGGLLFGGEGVGLGYDESGADITGYWQYASRTAASARGNTFVGIFVKTATVSAAANNFANWFKFGSVLNAGPTATTTYNNGTQFSLFQNVTQLGTSINITLGTPYMICAAWQANGAGSPWYFKIRNLLDGTLVANQSGTSTYSGTGNSTWELAGSAAFGKAFPGYVYLGAMGSKYMPPQVADEWLRNPWMIVDPTDTWALTDAGGGGGGSFSADVSESISAADTISAAMTAASAIAEAMSLADTPAASMSATATLSESIGLTDTISQTPTMTGAVEESINLADTVTETMSATAAMSESIALADTVSGSVGEVTAAMSESVSLVDTVSESMTATAAIAETITLSDTVAGAMTATASVSEAVSLADTVTAAVGAFSVSVSESITLADTVSAVMTATVAIAESLALADTPSVTMTASRSVSESMSLVDSIAGGLALTAAVSENIALADLVTCAFNAAIASDRRYIITGSPRRFTIAGAPRQFKVTK